MRALHRSIREVFSPEFADQLDHLRSEQGVHTLYKFRLPLPDGELRTANITVAPLLNRELEAVGRIVIIDDISDRVSMEAAAHAGGKTLLHRASCRGRGP